MCESTAFVRRGRREDKLLDEVARVQVQGGRVVLTGVLGQRATVRGQLVEVDLVGHRLVVREQPAKRPAVAKSRQRAPRR